MVSDQRLNILEDNRKNIKEFFPEKRIEVVRSRSADHAGNLTPCP